MQTIDNINKIIDFYLQNYIPYRNIFYYDKLNILYTNIPKNASTTLKYSLGIHNKVKKICELDTSIRNNYFHTHAYSLSCVLKNYVNIENANKIVVLRNPFSRLVSAYTHLIVNAPYNNTPDEKKIIKKLTDRIQYDISVKIIDGNSFYPPTPHTHTHYKYNTIIHYLIHNIRRIELCNKINNNFKIFYKRFIKSTTNKKNNIALANEQNNNIIPSFYQLCQYLLSHTDNCINDGHFASQLSNFSFRKYDHIFSFENLDNEWVGIFGNSIKLRRFSPHRTRTEYQISNRDELPFSCNLSNVAPFDLYNKIQSKGISINYELFYDTKEIKKMFFSRFKDDIIVYSYYFPEQCTGKLFDEFNDYIKSV